MARYRVDPVVVAQAHQRLGPLAADVANARNDLLSLHRFTAPSTGLLGPFFEGLGQFVDVWADRLRTDIEVLEGLSTTVAAVAADYRTTDDVVVPDAQGVTP